MFQFVYVQEAQKFEGTKNAINFNIETFNSLLMNAKSKGNKTFNDIFNDLSSFYKNLDTNNVWQTYNDHIKKADNHIERHKSYEQFCNEMIYKYLREKIPSIKEYITSNKLAASLWETVPNGGQYLGILLPSQKVPSTNKTIGSSLKELATIFGDNYEKIIDNINNVNSVDDRKRKTNDDNKWQNLNKNKINFPPDDPELGCKPKACKKLNFGNS